MNAFQFFYKSLYDKKVLAYSRFQPITKALLHVLMVVFIACIPFIIFLIMTYVSSINQLEESLENDMPAFSLKDGELHAEIEEPYVNDSLSEGVFVLDPNNELTSKDLAQFGEGIIFQQNEALLFKYGSTHSISYSLVGLQEVSDTELNERLADIKGFLPFLLAIVSSLMYSGVLGLAFLGVTMLAFVALLFRGPRRNIQYRHMWLITAYAMTLPVILFAWADVFIGGIPGLFLVLAVLCMIVYALSAIPKPKQKTK